MPGGQFRCSWLSRLIIRIGSCRSDLNIPQKRCEIALDLGEICDTAVQAGVEINEIRGAVYAFNGYTDEADDDDTITLQLALEF
jgi:type VI protein secretion system component VasF